MRARNYFGRPNADAMKVDRYTVLLVDQYGLWRYQELTRGHAHGSKTGRIAGRDALESIGEACSQWAAA